MGDKCAYGMFRKLQCVIESSAFSFEVLGVRSKESISEAASVTSCRDYMPSLQSKAKNSCKIYFAISSEVLRWKKKKSGFQTFKVPDSIKNKTEEFPKLRIVHC